MNILCSFRNEFDDVDVVLTASDEENRGPYRVTMTFNDGAISGPENNVDESFASLEKAMKRYLGLVNDEVGSIVSELG